MLLLEWTLETSLEMGRISATPSMSDSATDSDTDSDAAAPFPFGPGVGRGSFSRFSRTCRVSRLPNGETRGERVAVWEPARAA